jgi:hypothetical protein
VNGAADGCFQRRQLAALIPKQSITRDSGPLRRAQRGSSYRWRLVAGASDCGAAALSVPRSAIARRSHGIPAAGVDLNPAGDDRFHLT